MRCNYAGGRIARLFLVGLVISGCADEISPRKGAETVESIRLPIRFGEPDVDNLYPTVGALIINLGDRWQYYCSGTLITENLVLTAAHCVQAPDGPVNARDYLSSVTVDQVVFSLDFDQAVGFTAHIVDAIRIQQRFPGRRDGGQGGDIAILRLASPIPGFEEHRLIEDDVAPGIVGTAVGRGRQESMVMVDRATGDIIGYEAMKVGDREFASLTFQTYAAGDIVPGRLPQGAIGPIVGLQSAADEQMIFQSHSHPYSATCPGDSGSPIFVEHNGQRLIAGVLHGGNQNACHIYVDEEWEYLGIEESQSRYTSVAANLEFVQIAQRGLAYPGACRYETRAGFNSRGGGCQTQNSRAWSQGGHETDLDGAARYCETLAEGGPNDDGPLRPWRLPSTSELEWLHSFDGFARIQTPNIGTYWSVDGETFNAETGVSSGADSADDSQVVCIRCAGTALETCNGIDDNCDGHVDARPCGNDVGACAPGLQACAGDGWGECTGGVGPTAEICNGIDDDCDGKTDEHYVQVSTTCGAGVCATTGQTSCVDGQVQDGCNALQPGPSDATCDGVDNDCDGRTDEGYVAVSTLCGVGACAANGRTSCVGGHVLDDCRSGQPARSDVTCDGVDNDCDGQTDEGYLRQGTSCGVGFCAANGYTSCVGGQIQDSCSPGQPAPDDASCDGIDNNCNGQTDEGYVQLETTCGVGGCQANGRTACVDGQIQDSCTATEPSADDSTCNGVDDDCNGAVDEDFAAPPTTCGIGACRIPGHRLCADGEIQVLCAPGMAPTPDVTCDGIDDDCDGETDEGYEVTVTTCGEGACARDGQTSCVGGQVQDDCNAGQPVGIDDACDNIDDDCDGQTDESYVPENITCGIDSCNVEAMTACVDGEVHDNCEGPQPGEVCIGDPPAGCELRGDFNGDGEVTDADHSVWRNTFGQMDDLRADGNGDGIVDAADYTVWRDNLGSTCPQGA
jgi:hypothetical protein